MGRRARANAIPDRSTGMSKLSLQGRVVMISGASSGIGRATALAFAAEGAHLALSARRRERLDELAPQLTQAGAMSVFLHAMDVRDPGQVDAFVGAAVAALGRVDVLVNNAGLARGMDRVDAQDDQAWDAW